MRTRKPRILVVERDHEPVRELVARLRGEPYLVQWVHDDEAAHNLLAARRFDALVSALRAPRIDGLRLLRAARSRRPDACVVLLAEGGDQERGVAAMREGASDFQLGVIHAAKVIAVLERGFAHQATAAGLAEARERMDRQFGFEYLAGHSPAMHRVLEQAVQVAATRSPLLIEGEPGTGKRRIAQAVHQNGPRSAEPFVWVACDALSAGDAESELFGHEVAAAEPDGGPGSGVRVGRFERADRGTLFLDEVGALPETAQAALLRALHDGAFVPLGGREPRRADVRVIAATGRDLAAEAAAGRFRGDLYARLGVVRVRVPALRERREDLPALIAQLMEEVQREQGRRVSGITRGALDRLAAHTWPGNVRELRNVIEGMTAAADGRGPLTVSNLPESFRGGSQADGRLAVTVGMTVGEVERRLIAATLEHAGADKRRAAALLGIGLRTLYRKIREYGLG